MSQEASQDSGSDLPYEEYFQYVDQLIELYPTCGILYNIKIQSLLSAGRYKEAFLFLEHSSTLNPEMKEDLKNTYRTCGAQYFDISEYIVGPATGSPCLLRPDGDFIGPVEIKMTSNGCGMGLFATETIQRGDVLLISKALAVSHEPATNHNPLLQITKDALNSCGEKTRQIFLSHCLKDRSRFIPKMSDFVTESFGGHQTDWAMLCQDFDELTETEKDYQFDSILELIAFDDSSPLAMKEKSEEAAIFKHVPARMYYGVWLLPSFVNHSCLPNTARFNMGDLMRIHATTFIKAGEEITIPYFNVLVPFPFRHRACSNFGFTCVCKRCELEANTLERCSELKDLYSDYARISMPGEPERASQLQNLLFRVKNSVNYWRGTKSYRASFTPVFLASLSNRHINEERAEFCLVNDINFWDITSAIVETCPGSLLSLVFYHEFRSKLREFLALHGNEISVTRKELYGKYVDYAENYMVSNSSSIYGNPHLQKIVDNIVQQLI